MISTIDAVGAPGVGAIIWLETVFPPIPSEAVLPAAGYLAGLGELNVVSAIVWATVGSVLGALLLYWVGARFGVDRLRRFGDRMPLVSANDIDRAMLAFDRWQRPAVFWGRLVPGVRSLVSIPAGVNAMPLVQFTALTAVGSLFWNSALIGAGWWLGDRFGATADVSRWLNIAVAAGAVGLVAWFAIGRVRDRPAEPSDLEGSLR